MCVCGDMHHTAFRASHTISIHKNTAAVTATTSTNKRGLNSNNSIQIHSFAIAKHNNKYGDIEREWSIVNDNNDDAETLHKL